MRRNASCNKHALRGSRGGTLPIFALVIAVLCIVLAGVVDFGMMTTSKKQVEGLARSVSIYSLREFFHTSCETTDTTVQCINKKTAKGVDAANAAFKLNSLVGGNGTSPTVVSGFLNYHDDSDPTLRLTPGRWERDESCPLEADDQSKHKYCFVPSKPDTQKMANSLLMEGDFSPFLKMNSLQKIFAFSAAKSPTHVVATNVPIHGMVMVDVSGSMTYQSHPVSTKKWWEHMSYCMPQDNGGTVGFVDEQDDWNSCMSNFRSEATPSPCNPNAALWHYKSDYAAVSSLKDSDFTAFAGTDNDFAKHHPSPYVAAQSTDVSYHIDPYTCRIDSYWGGGAANSAPEPLGTVLQGLSQLTSEFQKRAVVGDKLGFIFYDARLGWTRTFLLTEDFDYLKKFVSLDSSQLKTMTGEPGASTSFSPSSYLQESGMLKLARHQIFPFTNSVTNTTQALATSFTFLNKDQNTNADEIPSSQFVVNISDGLINCGKVNGQEGCGNIYPYYHSGIQKLQEIAETSLMPNNVPFHSIIVGPAAHTVDLAPGGTCISDQQARTLGVSDGFVKDNWDGGASLCGNTIESAFESAAFGCRFLQAPHDMYHLSVLTRGLYLPIRPKSGCNVTSCTPGAIRYCDPQGREPQDQMKDAITQIMGQVAFAIVETEKER